MEFYSVSWDQLHDASFRLAQDIRASKKDHDLIVAIARGGMTVAHMLSDFLLLPVATFTISSYRDMQQNKLSEISYHVGGTLEGKRILLVDDISDTGKTFLRAADYLKELKAGPVTTAAPYVKPQTKYLPEFYVEQTDKWIILPYEVRETVEAIAKKMRSEGKTDEVVKQTLLKLGINEDYITTYIHA